jgi:hypothetical protein
MPVDEDVVYGREIEDGDGLQKDLMIGMEDAIDVACERG